MPSLSESMLMDVIRGECPADKAAQAMKDYDSWTRQIKPSPTHRDRLRFLARTFLNLTEGPVGKVESVHPPLPEAKDYPCDHCPCKDYDGKTKGVGNWTLCSCGHKAQDHNETSLYKDKEKK